MNFVFRNVRLAGLLTVVPANERTFDDDMKAFAFPAARSQKLKQVMGYDRHCIAPPGTCVSDLAVAGMNHLFNGGLLQKDGFDALILVTQSPDHFMPPTSNVIQGRLGLGHDLFCMDINQGCAGFVIGLIQAFLLLGQETIRRVVLINADVLSQKVSPRDRNSYPLIGDGASIAVVERSAVEQTLYGNLKMDGSRSGALIIPAGGFRTPCTTETARLQDCGDNNFRSQNDLMMDGTAVFQFVQTEVPTMIDELLAFAGADRDKIDYYLFHQPNRFMLQKLAEKMRVPVEKMPNNVVERFGNASGVTIPTVIAHNLAPEITQREYSTCLAGFGVGLTWSSILMKLGPLEFCELIWV